MRWPWAVVFHIVDEASTAILEIFELEVTITRRETKIVIS